jgi:hypothetical protein
LTTGPDEENISRYVKGDEFVCSEEDAKRLGTSVQVLGPIEEPKIVTTTRK